MRAAGYFRVSTEEQTEGYSIDAQRRAFRALCEGRGWIVEGEYVEAGKSAHTDDIRKRPVFKQAMDDALAGKYDVLVVHKIDRFSRKLRITLEYFEKLGKAGVGFVSIENQIDYSTPEGKMMLSIQGAVAELYSDNLSRETKKGWTERKAQGLYCGLLPFGAMKGEDGVPVRHPDTYPGLATAFELAARGNTYREIAQALNAQGYRTTGNQGSRPFSKDTVAGLIQNRFYVGELPDGNGGWVRGRHEPFISGELWDDVQKRRRQNATSSHVRCRTERKARSLTGITYCWYCKGRIHICCTKNGRPRLGCYNRAKGWDCGQKSAALAIYEQQVWEYLKSFHIPEDYQSRILEGHRRLQAAYSDTALERAKWEAQLERLKKLYQWGDIGEEEYRQERDAAQKELRVLAPVEDDAENLDRLAGFLGSVHHAWEVATGEQRNMVARTLFQEIWVKDDQVVAVRPQPELQPFFELNYEEFVNKVMKKRPRWGSNRPLPESVCGDLYPVCVMPRTNPRHKLSVDIWTRLAEERKTSSLRELASKYGVSHESVRRALKASAACGLRIGKPSHPVL